MEAAWEAALQAHTASDAAQDDLWAWVIRAFDPRAPAEATERQQLQSSLASLHGWEDELGTWFLLCEALTSVSQASAQQDAMITMLQTCVEWIHTRQALIPELGLPCAEYIPAFFRQCKMVFSAALPPDILDVMQALVASRLTYDAHHVHLRDDGVHIGAHLRRLGLDTLVQSALTHTATELLQKATAQATEDALHQGAHHTSVYPMLHTLLEEQLLPSLMTMLDATCEGPSTQVVPDWWDASVSVWDAVPSVPSHDRDALYKRLDYSLAQAVGHRRVTQFFALIGTYPQSRGAMDDLVLWLEKTGDRTYLAQTFSEALHTQLLHPGVDTHAILVYYVNMVYALRLVDSTGVVLSHVLPPVQKYLRQRSDTIQAVVHALLGDDPAFELLRTELEQGGGESDMANPLGAEADEEQYTRTEFWHDPTWMPRPVDAGPEFSQMRSRDVVGLLVTIFDDHDGFLQALERHTAQLLVRTCHYDTARVQRNNAIFKRRLGESSLHHCDIMLADVAFSQALDRAYHRDNSASSMDQAVHPMIISRQFWPDMEMGTYTLPNRLAAALDTFAAYYAKAHPTKRVRWLPYLGTVDVDIELAQGRCVHARVTPLQAAVVELVAGLSDGSESTSMMITADNVATALRIDREAALAALRFWCTHGLWRELPAPASGSFELE
ncbi:component of the anaphase promoting complex [Malassezia pachydermatis]|uniref:Component of the anaphase promoting complex n=1 Tax=Malassezia pachydermatis TaxID=77020 RepID=A0A0M8MNM6_9BASI|nr:component of the anaphase promoting complex [Malassezia pachydermatis]KOS15208.1 component of the anaphase promoting complex [Malassezia pachydermatis]